MHMWFRGAKLIICFADSNSLLIGSFGGYGAQIAYSESLQKDSSHTDSWNVEITFGIGFKADIQLLFFSIGPKLSLELGVNGGVTIGGSTETSTSVSRSRGFTLSDPDEYDVFDVEVCTHVSWRSSICLTTCLLCLCRS